MHISPIHTDPTMNARTPVQVEAYAGASFPERPRAVWVGGSKLDVVKVIRQWRTPDALHFQVEVESLGRVELVYRDNSWFLIS